MEWSPFYVLPKADLTPSGLLQLDVADSEVELLRRSPIEVRHEGNDEPMAPRPKNVVVDEEWIPRSTNLTLILTTHRLVLCDTNNDHRLIHLSNVHVVRGIGGPSFQHPRATYKMVVSTLIYGDLVVVFRSGVGHNATQKDRDACVQQLDTALKRKLWERAQRMEEKTATQHAAARRRVGVDHILQRQKMSQQQAQTLTTNAFRGDSDALLEQTGELLKVIHKSKALLERMEEGTNNGQSSSAGSSAEDREAAKKLASLLSDMGMTSALTKSQVAGSGGSGGFRRGGSNVSSGGPMTPSQRQYYELTARQVADFLLPRLKDPTTNAKQGQGVGSGKGIMSLTDVYCLFNRARGTNLISPEDLRQACSLLGELNVGLSQRTFPSGVIVVQLDAMALDASHPERSQRLVDLCRPATTALEASHILNMSPLLAMEQLEEAERLGMLCRDVTLETVRFYPNKFVEW